MSADIGRIIVAWAASPAGWQFAWAVGSRAPRWASSPAVARNHNQTPAQSLCLPSTCSFLPSPLCDKLLKRLQCRKCGGTALHCFSGSVSSSIQIMVLPGARWQTPCALPAVGTKSGFSRLGRTFWVQALFYVENSSFRDTKVGYCSAHCIAFKMTPWYHRKWLGPKTQACCGKVQVDLSDYL